VVSFENLVVLKLSRNAHTEEFMAIIILDVGQCGFDGPRMAALWRDKLDATVDRVANGKDAAQSLKKGGYDVVLVNRVLAADGSSGLDVIADLQSRRQKGGSQDSPRPHLGPAARGRLARWQ
jgi:hypothetical protein